MKVLSKTYQDNLALIRQGVACTNDKPITCYSGSAPGAVLMGMTVAEFVEKPLEGVLACIEMYKRLQEEAGPLHCLNSTATVMNMVVGVTMLWYSKALIPGKDIPEYSVWQVKEQKLIGPEAYDEILQMGYNNFIQQKILPRIIDPEYLGYYLQYAQEHGAEVEQAYLDLGIPILQNGLGTMVPFEQLCGMRSMNQFYMDCYKRMDKLKEVSDFIFKETYAQTEAMLTQVEDDPAWHGVWCGGWRTASAMLNPKIWEALVWPYMKASAEQVIRHGKLPIMHLDQDWNRDIQRFSELPAGKLVLNTDGMTDLPRARKLLPGYALMGDVPATLLTTAKPQQVTDYVNRLIDEVGPQGLFVCPGCDCPVGAKFENLVAMVKATNDWK